MSGRGKQVGRVVAAALVFGAIAVFLSVREAHFIADLEFDENDLS